MNEERISALMGDDAQVTQASDTDYEQSSRRARDFYAQRRGRRALATVYDATAGRVTSRKLFQDEEDDGLYGEQQQQQQQQSQPAIEVIDQNDQQQPSLKDRLKLSPEEVLFRRKDAPIRFEEFDIYRSHERDLPRNGRGVLPESDLLRAIHAYSSRFYGALGRMAESSASASSTLGFKGPQRNMDECSMDETALLAFGVLLEEAGREVLGRRGHCVFTEAAAGEAGGAEAEADSQIDSSSASGSVMMGHADVGSSSQRSRRKRRRVTKGERNGQ